MNSEAMQLTKNMTKALFFFCILPSAKTSEDGKRNESSAGYCHAGAAAGKHSLCEVSNTVTEPV